MKRLPILLGIVALLIVLTIVSDPLFTVHETETVILTRFGAPVGDPITEPGLHWKTPFVMTVNRLEKRILEWDGLPAEMPTKDKTYISVDTFARWRIGDPSQFFVKLRDERSAQSRIEDIIGSEVRTAVAGHDLIEVVRSDKDRVLPPNLTAEGTTSSVLPVATRGRLELQKDILKAAAPKLASIGIELLDLRIKRVNYNQGVVTNIYQRMISERQQIAQRFRSEGEGEAARINGRRGRDLLEVESEAYKKVQELRGAADAEASRIYAEAYDKSPESRAFYGFLKTLDTYRTILGKQTNLILSTDSELFRLLERSKQ
ncbi:MAG TPA: protease modulator HflC [Planctomycetes bacterium]|nr:protease modulator HflC [Planctomycetota bacterium]